MMRRGFIQRDGGFVIEGYHNSKELIITDLHNESKDLENLTSIRLVWPSQVLDYRLEFKGKDIHDTDMGVYYYSILDPIVVSFSTTFGQFDLLRIPEPNESTLYDPKEHLQAHPGRWVVLALKFRGFQVLEVSPFAFPLQARESFDIPFEAWQAVTGRHSENYDWYADYAGYHYECHWTVIR